MGKNINDEFVNFLLVEDDEDHAALVKRTLEEHRIYNRVFHVPDGAEALKFLNQQGKYKDDPIPHIVILDLKLPKMSGHEVLRAIKTDENLQHIPVVVLTTSDMELDRESAYKEHANSYLIKPLDFEKFKQMINELSLYWGLVNSASQAMKKVKCDEA